jgi:hypothetical protein
VPQTDTLPPDIAALVAAEDETLVTSTELVERVRQHLRRARDKQLELAEGELYTLRHKTLPDLMNAARIDTLGLPAEGNYAAYDCRLHPWSEARLPEGAEEAAYSWMEEAGFGDIVKHTFTVALPRDSHEDALELRRLLEENDFDFEEKRGVHFQTLQAFVREQLKKGTPLPADKLGLTIGQHVKVEERQEPTMRKRGKQ